MHVVHYSQKERHKGSKIQVQRFTRTYKMLINPLFNSGYVHLKMSKSS